MSKNKIMIVLLIMLSIGIISLYTTYAYEEENFLLDIPQASNNHMIMSIKKSTSKEITIAPNEEKFLDFLYLFQEIFLLNFF